MPRVIYQTFPTKRLPPELQANIDSLKALNPTWEHVIFDDRDIEDFIAREYGPDIHRRFLTIDPTYGAARADLFRYLLLYRRGGVYLDIKSASTRPLNDVLRPDDAFLIAQWPRGAAATFHGAGQHAELAHVDGGEYQQWFLASSPGHPFLKAVLENVLRNLTVYSALLNGVGRSGVLRTTGPIAFTLAIQPILGLQPHRVVDAERDLGFIYSVYPMVDGGVHEHLRLFKTHYSKATVSLIHLRGVAAFTVPPLIRTRIRVKAWLRALLDRQS